MPQEHTLNNEHECVPQGGQDRLNDQIDHMPFPDLLTAHTLLFVDLNMYLMRLSDCKGP